jgi:polysaccharide pyruvyl transferase WcaK-like protein
MNISIVGWYNKNNMGDDYFKKIFNKKFSKFNTSFYNSEFKKIDTNSDVLILGGGDVLSEFFIDNNNLDKIKVKMAIGVGMYKEEDYKVVSNFNYIYHRNKSSDRDFKFPAIEKVRYIPDIVFSENFNKSKQKMDKKSICVFLSQDEYLSFIKWGKKEEIDKKINNVIEELNILSNDYDVYFVDLCNDDIRGDHNLFNSISNRLKFEPRRPNLNIDNILTFISNMDHCVCMRLHSHIFSIIARTNFTSISDSGKCKILLNDLKIESNDKSIIESLNKDRQHEMDKIYLECNKECNYIFDNIINKMNQIIKTF